MLAKSAGYLKYAPIALIVVGLMFIGFFAIRNAPIYLMSYFTIPSEPTNYSFSTYDELLKANVNDGLVNYKKIKKSKLLDQSLNELATTSSKKLSNEGQLCYWINAYNLTILKIISDKYPIKTLHQVGTARASKKFIVGGKVMSAQNILAREITPRVERYKITPEVVFLICSGTLSYPPLTNHAITPKTLEVDAKVAAFKYITNPKNVYFDRNQGIFFITSLFKKYETTFRTVGHTPHSFTSLYLDPKSTPDFGDIMLTKTYFSKVDYRINDTSLIQKAGKKASRNAVKIKVSETATKTK